VGNGGAGCWWPWLLVVFSSSPIASPRAVALCGSLACCCALPSSSLRMLAAIPSICLSSGPRSVGCGRCWEPCESFARVFAQLTTVALLDVARPVGGVVRLRTLLVLPSENLVYSFVGRRTLVALASFPPWRPNALPC
jgi:hypothetical protein